ncbi:hypothetical protein NEMBOFW57_007392 [Staphylotrichum longicolle]|uniref:Uncharacterized protein n=1 Tax=Staphylotrichum longicolle TaxID=669026 RepID=A0AAD4EV12_9PEZI|nr:hypothetical protein NEMBOFW57_007392 [Staphylotrichum longicolle]
MTSSSSSSSSCILWQNDRKTVVLLDLPRSIEEAQVPSSELTAANGASPPTPLRRLISALPPAVPFPTPEPKAGGSDPPAASPSALLADLMTQAAVESALEEIRGHMTAPAQARRPRAYRPAADPSAVRALLRQIPVASRLAPGGLVAVWVTNAPRFVDLLTRPQGGVFAEWDVELVGEWTWAKVTTAGEPVVAVGSAWRKPWERLLIARRRKKGAAGGDGDGRGGGGGGEGEVGEGVGFRGR